MVADGDLIQVIGRTEIYVIENGIRRLIPNMETFFDAFTILPFGANPPASRIFESMV